MKLWVVDCGRHSTARSNTVVKCSSGVRDKMTGEKFQMSIVRKNLVSPSSEHSIPKWSKR